MLEIERKFLVKNQNFKKEVFNVQKIAQGYLCTDAERTVRVRIKGDQAFLTIKGKSNESGTTRFEWEKSILVDEATELLKLCLPGMIEKNRYEIKIGNHMYEVDEFFGDNDGLIVAEIELNSEDENFLKPEWLGEEVTHDHSYSNSSLINHPFTKW